MLESLDSRLARVNEYVAYRSYQFSSFTGNIPGLGIKVILEFFHFVREIISNQCLSAVLLDNGTLDFSTKSGCGLEEEFTVFDADWFFPHIGAPRDVLDHYHVWY